MSAGQSTNLTAEFASRVAERAKEWYDLETGKKNSANLPKWVRQVMSALKAQYIPKEIESVFDPVLAIFGNGVLAACVFSMSRIVAATPDGPMFSKKILGKFSRAIAAGAEPNIVAIQELPEFREMVWARLKAESQAEQIAFAKGLLTGFTLGELLEGQSKPTDASGLYVSLWLHWPEVSKMKSHSEVYRLLESVYGEKTNGLGSFERFRKLANRIGLSFKAKQKRPKH